MNRLDVRLHFSADEVIPVGILAQRDRDDVFQHSEDFL